MYTIPKCFRNKEILDLIDYFMYEGYKSYEEMDNSRKELLVEKCIKALGHEGDLWLCESDCISDIMLNFRNYLLCKGDKDSAIELLASMTKTARNYFAQDMDMLFNEIIEENIASSQFENRGIFNEEEQYAW